MAISAVLGSTTSHAAQTRPVPRSQEQPAGRVRVAEGEYQIFRKTDNGGVGPFALMVYNFREAWTLWRLPDGSFDVEGERNYESPKDALQHSRFSVHLSSAFRVLGLTEFRQLRWRADSGPLTCDFLPAKIVCSSNAKDPAQNIRLDVPMGDDFGFLWPISAFSLSGITRSDDRNRIPVQLLSLDEPDPEHPIYASVLDGFLQYLGNEELTVANKKWHADKFELKVPMHMPFLIWTSPQGLLLAFADENQQKTLTDDGMKLVRFKQYSVF
jgi:hypothetical protein